MFYRHSISLRSAFALMPLLLSALLCFAFSTLPRPWLSLSPSLPPTLSLSPPLSPPFSVSLPLPLSLSSPSLPPSRSVSRYCRPAHRRNRSPRAERVRLPRPRRWRRPRSPCTSLDWLAWPGCAARARAFLLLLSRPCRGATDPQSLKPSCVVVGGAHWVSSGQAGGVCFKQICFTNGGAGGLGTNL